MAIEMPIALRFIMNWGFSRLIALMTDIMQVRIAVESDVMNSRLVNKMSDGLDMESSGLPDVDMTRPAAEMQTRRSNTVRIKSTCEIDLS